MVFGFTACGNKCDHTYDNACDATCNECDKTREVGAHDYGSTWFYDENGHWQVCSCDAKSDVVAHTPGLEATATAPQVCTVCGYVITEALGEAITYTTEINYKFATAEEAKALIVENVEYYDGMSQEDLNYRVQEVGATKEDYIELVKTQLKTFTDDEKVVIDKAIARIEAIFVEKGYKIPKMDEIMFIKSDMQEELGASGYTIKNQIFLESGFVASFIDSADIPSGLDAIIVHELFHCLTRAFPTFKTDMYEIINFTTVDEPFTLADSVKSIALSNPDVNPASSYATFTINGEKKNSLN